METPNAPRKRPRSVYELPRCATFGTIETKIEKLLKTLDDLTEKLDKQFNKMMIGFKAIEKAFQLCGSTMMGFQENLCEATGQMEVDPWEM